MFVITNKDKILSLILLEINLFDCNNTKNDKLNTENQTKKKEEYFNLSSI